MSDYRIDGTNLEHVPDEEVVTIPDEIESIELNAFNGCTECLKIEVGSENTHFKSVDGNLYSKDGKTLVKYAMGKKAVSFAVPEGVENIDGLAFVNNQYLEEIVLPSTFKNAAPYMTCGAVVLSRIKVSEENPLYKVVDDIVYTKDGTKILLCPPKKYIKNLEIPKTVKVIGNSAFLRNESIMSITLPEGLQVIEDLAFSGCSYLSSSSGSYSYELIIPKSVKTIGEAAFNDIGIRKLEIPGNITKISDSAFKFCKNLDTLTICEGVKEVGEYAFSYCRNLNYITFPESLETIGNCAFEECNKVRLLTIRENTVNMGKYVFADCAALALILCGAKSMPAGWSKDWNGKCRANVRWDTVEEVLFLANKNEVKDKVLVKYKDKPYNKKCVVPNGITEIAWGAFQYVNWLDCIEVKSTVKVIRQFAFENSSVSEVILNEGVEDIWIGVFDGCKNLKSIHIPASVKKMNFSFKNCVSLASITIDEKNPSYKVVDGVVFSKDGKTLYRYPLAKEGSEYVVPKDVKLIKGDAFLGCTKLKKVVLPAGLDEIEFNSFDGCVNLESIDLPEQLKSIGAECFAQCDKLTEIYIPSTVKTVGRSAFRSCANLKKVYRTSFFMPKGWKEAMCETNAKCVRGKKK